MPKEYDIRINAERISLPRLIDRSFFQLVMRKLTHYCLRKAMLELVCAKQLLDELEKKGKDFEFDVELGCQDFCELHCVLEYLASVGWLTFIIVESLSFS